MVARHWMTIALAVVIVGAGACASGPGDLGAMRIQRERGKVQILRGTDVIDVDQVADLEPDDIVITGATGAAHFNLATTDQSIAVAPGSRVLIRSTDTVEDQKGSLLATASGAPLKVAFDGASASFRQARFRLDRGFGSARAAT